MRRRDPAKGVDALKPDDLKLRDEVIELADEVLAGRASAAQEEQLKGLLRDDPLAAKYYFSFIHDSLLLHELGDATKPVHLEDAPQDRPDMAAMDQARANGCEPSMEPAALVSHRRAMRSDSSWLTWVTRQPRVLSGSVAVLVIGVFLTAMAFIAAPVFEQMANNEPEEVPVETPSVAAHLTGLHDPVWTDGHERFVGLKLLQGQRLRLESGVVELTHADGAVVAIEGPCEYVGEARGRGKLSYGRLQASVPEEAAGFAIETPAVVITDLGTEFGVESST